MFLRDFLLAPIDNAARLLVIRSLSECPTDAQRRIRASLSPVIDIRIACRSRRTRNGRRQTKTEQRPTAKRALYGFIYNVGRNRCQSVFLNQQKRRMIFGICGYGIPSTGAVCFKMYRKWQYIFCEYPKNRCLA